MNPGSIVRCRNRDWVLLPSEDSELYLLRPLTGLTEDTVAIHRRLADLIAYSLPEEKLRPSHFKPPTVDDLADATSSHLLWQAARLTLREGATPFRSLGRISIRPRVYQFVPLLMALRLDPIRLLIADDVGVGKTIEALLVAREMLDRGEIKRLCVLCPAYLCEQWQKELAEKFNLDAVIVRSGTINQLERRKTGTESIYRHYPIQVASIDFLKSDRNKHLFLLDCPDLVIVDEAHGAAVPGEGNQTQQLRHQLIRTIAENPQQHLMLLTATPHSGIDSAFRSLLSLLEPEFATWDTSGLTEPQRIHLARHFVQRTRRDIEHDWEGEHCFPERQSSDTTYRLSRPYTELFQKTFAFCSEMVQTGKTLSQRSQRVRYWAALALLRCVMSSPAAAVSALESRHESLADSDGDDGPDFRSFVFESTDDRTDDEQPIPPLEAAEATLGEAERRRLRELGKLAAGLHLSKHDTKLAGCAALISQLLTEGFHPIVWCRYIATAESLADGLKSLLAKQFPKLRLVAVTGRIGDEERRAKVDELSLEPNRVLIATDCLSEGINLQHAFNAVIHYDLPWNPNRLEQREGRVDRYGQQAPLVKAIRYFSPDSPVDGVVLDVLLNKAREIHKTLGTHVPVPTESETVTEALLNALFLRGEGIKSQGRQQKSFDFGDDDLVLQDFHRRWLRDAEREKINRSRFAQRALKPAEVRQELERTDEVLGDPSAVREFVLNAAQRMGLSLRPEKGANVFRLAVVAGTVSALPPVVAQALPGAGTGPALISFVSPTPLGAEYVGRNHPFVAALARFLLEEALTKGSRAIAARCGVIGTRLVDRRTTLALLRSRYLVNQPDRPPLLAEEVLVTGFRAGEGGGQAAWLAEDEALRLLGAAAPDVNVPMPQKRLLVQQTLDSWKQQEDELHRHIQRRAVDLEQNHKRIRQAVSLKVRQLTVTPQLPPDLLGLIVLQPVEN
jgi:superfamily II DNA or RNA helicase